MNHQHFFNQAALVAHQSLCLRDACGAIIVIADKIISSGYNAPPQDDLLSRKCTLDLKDSSKPKSDRTCCVHAEWRAIMNAIKTGMDLTASTIYFTRIDQKGNILKSGEPYCTVCSRLALDAQIGFWALWHEDGIKLYDAKTYNKISYQFHNNSLTK